MSDNSGDRIQYSVQRGLNLDHMSGVEVHLLVWPYVDVSLQRST